MNLDFISDLPTRRTDETIDVGAQWAYDPRGIAGRIVIQIRSSLTKTASADPPGWEENLQLHHLGRDTLTLEPTG